MYEGRICGKAMLNALNAIHELNDYGPIHASDILQKIYDAPGKREEKELDKVLDFLSCIGVLERVRPAIKESYGPAFKATELFAKAYWNIGWHGDTLGRESAKC
jgi:hypothetical protein